MFEVSAKVPLSKVREYFKVIKQWKQKQNKKPFTLINAVFSKYPDVKSNRKNVYRISIPLGAEDEKPLQVPKEILEELKAKGLEVLDYGAGLVSNPKYRNRIEKLGKHLSPDTKRLFDNDPQRQGKSNQASIIISRHPYDLLGMSTDRGWESCMELYTGSNREYVRDDILKGTLIAYVVNPNDKNVNNPRARILLKPAYNEAGKLGFIIDKEYGGPISGFRKSLTKWATKNFKASGRLILDPDLYDDDGNLVLYVFPSIKALYNAIKDERSFAEIIDAQEYEQLLGPIKSAFKNKEFVIRAISYATESHSDALAKYIDKELINDPDVRRALLSSKLYLDHFDDLGLKLNEEESLLYVKNVGSVNSLYLIATLSEFGVVTPEVVDYVSNVLKIPKNIVKKGFNDKNLQYLYTRYISEIKLKKDKYEAETKLKTELKEMNLINSREANLSLEELVKSKSFKRRLINANVDLLKYTQYGLKLDAEETLYYVSKTDVDDYVKHISRVPTFGTLNSEVVRVVSERTKFPVSLTRWSKKPYMFVFLEGAS